MTSKHLEDRDVNITFRANELLKRKMAMRASQLGMNNSEYIRKLIRDDLKNSDIPDPE